MPLSLLDPVVGYAFFALLGLVFGSFGNVVIGRLPAGKSLNGRSHCPHCGRTLGPLELVPVLSWAALRAKCRGCKQPISAQYPLIEIAAGLLFGFALFLGGFDPLRSLVIALALWTMLMITVIDMRTRLIPDVLTAFLALCGGALAVLDGALPIFAPLIGMLFFGLQWTLSRGRWVGSGDVFLAGALGLLVGTWEKAVIMLFLAYILGALVAVVLLLTGKASRGAHLAFGPFLVLGAFLAFVLGEQILGILFI